MGSVKPKNTFKLLTYSQKVNINILFHLYGLYFFIRILFNSPNLIFFVTLIILLSGCFECCNFLLKAKNSF